MKKCIIIIFVFVAINISAQDSLDSIVKETNVKVTSVSYNVDSSDELKTINWTNIKELFHSNKEDETIEMNFSLNYPKSKYKIKSSIKVGGKSKDIDSLIIRAKKGIKAIIKISNKYKN